MKAGSTGVGESMDQGSREAVGDDESLSPTCSPVPALTLITNACSLLPFIDVMPQPCRMIHNILNASCFFPPCLYTCCPHCWNTPSFCVSLTKTQLSSKTQPSDLLCEASSLTLLDSHSLIHCKHTQLHTHTHTHSS